MSHLDRASVRWTTERVAELSRLWREGRSASQIAAALGVSRNAVIGKVHRLGLSNRGAHPKPTSVRRMRASRPGRLPASSHCAASAPAAAWVEPIESLVGLVARLEALPPAACHWPIGDPKHADFAWCGRQAAVQPYCAAHRQVAYRRR